MNKKSFVREDRYTVLKNSDVNGALNADERDWLISICEKNRRLSRQPKYFVLCILGAYLTALLSHHKPRHRRRNCRR
jgi:hypothetical protein